MLHVVPCAQQAFLLSSRPQKQHGPARRGLQRSERTRKLQHTCTSGSIVARAMKDLRANLAMMIPVAAINHVLILQLRITSRHLGKHIH